MSNFNDYINRDTLRNAYHHTQMNHGKYKVNAINFHRYDELQIEQLYQELVADKYRVGKYNTFEVYEPKQRTINAPAYRDKIVQFALHKALRDIYGSVYLKHSYACLSGRGPHRCAEQIQHNMRVCQRNHGDAWVVKADIKKFFYSIDRERLKNILTKQIKCSQLLTLCCAVIDSSPEGLYGIPLGNVTSQDYGNIYMNEVDQFVVRYLGYKYYVRFMDDIVVIVPTREEADALLVVLGEFLCQHLGLGLNSKSQIFPAAQGVNACGFKIHKTHRLLRTHSKNAMKRRIKAMHRKVTNNKLSIKRTQQAVNSWIGHAMHCNSYSLILKIFLPYNYIDLKEVFKSAMGKNKRNRCDNKAPTPYRYAKRRSACFGLQLAS